MPLLTFPANTPKAYRKLKRALQVGRLDWADRLLADGDGRNESAWTALLTRPVSGERDQEMLLDPVATLAKRQSMHAVEVWDRASHVRPNRRHGAYALLERHGIPLDPDQALALLWRAGNSPADTAYWQAKGVSLKASRDRLTHLMLEPRPARHTNSTVETWFCGPSLAKTLPPWERADPELFDSVAKRSAMFRLLTRRNANSSRVMEILTAWENHELDLSAQSKSTQIQLDPTHPGVMEVAAGSVLTDVVDHGMRWLDERLAVWEKEQKGPTPSFWKTLDRFEQTIRALQDRGSDLDECNAQGMSARACLRQGPGGEFLHRLERQRTLARHPMVPSSPRSRRRI